MPLHRVCGVFVFLSVCLISFTAPCDGGNILVFPVDGSHWINMKVLLEELHARGHNITVIRASTSWYIAEKSPLYTSITLDMNEGLENFFEVYLKEHMRVCHFGLCIGPHGGHAVMHQDNDLFTPFFVIIVFRRRERGPQHLLSSNSPNISFL